MCKFCDNANFAIIGYHIYDADVGIYTISGSGGKVPVPERFNFCPVCGEPLTEENFMSKRERMIYRNRNKGQRKEENPMNEKIKFDPNDLDGMIALMDEYGDSSSPFWGENENGEAVSISILHDRITVATDQENGWRRINTYYDDGARDETFDRWRK